MYSERNIDGLCKVDRGDTRLAISEDLLDLVSGRLANHERDESLGVEEGQESSP